MEVSTDLIANSKDIEKYKYLMECAICTSLAIYNDPQCCSCCENAVYCKKCITDWVNPN